MTMAPGTMVSTPAAASVAQSMPEADTVRVMVATMGLALTLVSVRAMSSSTHENMKQKNAVTPTPEQAQLLEVDGATPLLSVERIAYTYNDVPMELRRGLYRTDTHHYHSTLN